VIGEGRTLIYAGENSLSIVEGDITRGTIALNGTTINASSNESGKNHEYIIRPLPDGGIAFYPWEPGED
jgi:hypothetical protein